MNDSLWKYAVHLSNGGIIETCGVVTDAFTTLAIIRGDVMIVREGDAFEMALFLTRLEAGKVVASLTDDDTQMLLSRLQARRLDAIKLLGANGIDKAA